MTNQEIINSISRVYIWFNHISNPTVSFFKTELEDFFTPNFVMEMNDKILTHDYASLFTHFEKFRESGFILNVKMPFQDIIVSDDKRKCIVKYNINKKNREGKSCNINVIAIWDIATDGRFDKMNEVVNFEDGEDIT